MENELKVYYSPLNISKVYNHHGEEIDYLHPPKNYFRVWEFVDSNDINVNDYGCDKDGHFLVFFHREDALKFKLSFVA